MLNYNFIPGTYMEGMDPIKDIPEVDVNAYASAINAARGSSEPNYRFELDPIRGSIYNEIPEEEKGEFTKGVFRGIDSTQALLYGGTGAVGDILNIDTLRDWGYEGYLRNMEEANENAAAVGSYSDVDSIGSAWQYAQGVLGELVPTLATSLVSGGIGAAAGKYYGAKVIRKAVADQIEDKVQKGIADHVVKGTLNDTIENTIRAAATKEVLGNLRNKGAMLAMGFQTSLMEGGSNWGQDVEAHGIENTSPGQDMLFGIASGAVETILGAEVSLFKALTGKTVSNAVEQKFRHELAKGLPKAMASEGGTEAIQEILSSINANIIDAKGLITEDDIEGIINAAVAGAIGGGVLHVPTILSSRRNAKAKTADQKTIDDTVNKIETAKAEREALAEQQAREEQEATALAEKQKRSLITPAREALALKQKEEIDSFNSRWDEDGKKIYSDYEKYKDVLERPNEYPDKARKDAFSAKKKYDDYQEKRNTGYISLTNRLYKEQQIELAKERVQNPYWYTGREERSIEERPYTNWDGREVERAVLEQKDQEAMLSRIKEREEADKLNPTKQAEEAQKVELQMWKQYADKEEAAFNEEWDKKETKIKGTYDMLRKQQAQSREVAAPDAVKKNVTELGKAAAAYSKFKADKQKAWDKLQARINRGYSTADGHFVSAARIAANKAFQQQQIDKELGSGAFDSLSQTLQEASIYYGKVNTAIDNRLKAIDEAIRDMNEVISEAQGNLTLTSEDYKYYKDRVAALTKLRAATLRSRRDINKKMGEISKQNAVLSTADFNKLGLDIQEMYHLGESLLNLERTNDIFRGNQETQLKKVSSNLKRIQDAVKRARLFVDNNVFTPAEQTSRTVGSAITGSTSTGNQFNKLTAEGQKVNAQLEQQNLQTAKQQATQIFNNVESTLSNVNLERDYPLANPQKRTEAIWKGEIPASDQLIVNNLNRNFNILEQEQIAAARGAAELKQQNDNITQLMKATRQKKDEPPARVKNKLDNTNKFYQQYFDKLAKADIEARVQLEKEIAEDQQMLAAWINRNKLMEESARKANEMFEQQKLTFDNVVSSRLGQSANRVPANVRAVKSVMNFLKNTLKSLPGLKDNTVICYDQNDASIPLELKNMLANINLGLTKGVKYLFLGTQGSYNLDLAEEMYTRSDNYIVALKMEREGKTSRQIKIATGWERGLDGNWKYEIDDSFYKAISDLPVEDFLNIYGNSTEFTLGEFLPTAEELFIAYPELRDMTVKLEKQTGSAGYYSPSHNLISLNIQNHPSEWKLTLLHEIQHAIQEIEGFALGESFPDVKPMSREESMTYIRKRFEYEDGEIPGFTIRAKRWLRENGYYDSIDSLINDIKSENFSSSSLLHLKHFIDSISESAMPKTRNELESFSFELALIEDDISDPYFEEEYEKSLKEYNDQANAYFTSPGEREAVNVQMRHTMSASKRRRTSLHKTAFKDLREHYGYARAMNGQVKGAYYNGKLYIFAKNMEGKEDAIRTLIHEGVAHYGLRSIMNNEQLGQFLNLVFNSFANTDSWKKFAAARPEYFKTNDRLTQAEEYVAYIAEQMKVSELINPENQSIFNRIVMFLRNILSKLGLKTTLTHKDIRDVLKLSAYNLQKKGGQKDLISELNNIDMYQADQQNKEMTLSEEPVYGVKFDDVQNAKSYFADADSARTGIPYTRFAKNEPNLTNTLNLNDSLDEQHDKIKTRIAKLARDFGAAPAIDAVDNETFYVSMFNRVFGPYPSEQDAKTFIDNDAMLSSITGWDVYNFLASAMDSKRKATEIMNAYGIRGAQYLNMGKNTYYLFEGNNINTVPYQYDLNKLSEPKFLVTNPKDMVLDPETGEPTTKDTPDQWTYHNELFNQVARESSWLRRLAGVLKTGTSRADDGTLIEHNGWERFVEGTVDRYRRLKVVQDYLKKKFKGAVDFSTNVYQNLQGLTNRISRRQVDAENKYLKPIEDVLGEVTADLPIYKDGKLIGYKKSTDSDYQDFMLRLFDGFLHARHAQERNKSVSERFRGRRWLDKDGNPHHKNMKSAEQGQDIINPSGMSDAEAQHLIDILGSISGFQEAAALVDKMNRYTLETMLEMKLITQEDFNNMAKYNYYVPLTGWEDMVEHFAPGRYRPRGRSLSTGSKRPVQFAKGRDNKLPSSPLLRSWQQMDDIIALGLRNKVMRGFGQLVKNTSSETELWEVDRKNPEAVRLQVTKNGDIILVTKPSELHGSGDSAVSYIDENGKPVRIVIKDKWLADALRGENMAPTGAIVDMMRKYTGMMSKLMTSRNPLFILTNPIRDLATAYLNLGSVIEENQMRGLMEKTSTIQWNVFKEATTGNLKNILFDLAMADEGKKPFDASKYDAQLVQDVMDWRKNGGHTKSISVYDMQDRSKALRAGIRKDGIMKQYDEAMKYLDILSDAAENNVRFSVYRNIQRAFEENIHQRAKAEGWSSARVQQEIEMAKQKSANIALDCTVNFTKRGAWANVFNPLFAFSSASVQGFARIANNLWRPTSTPLQNFKRVSKFMAMGTCAPLMHGFICRAIMGDDEDGLNKYDKIPAYIKETNLIIPMPFGDGGYIKVPLPYGYNVFWSMGTTLDTVMAGHQHPADGALSIMKNALSNITPLDPSQGTVAFVPTIFKPLVELAANENFAGAPIKPEGYYTDMLPEHMKSWERTPHGYKWVAGQLNFITGGFMTKSNIGALDISPETIEHLANSYLGGIYRIFSQAADLALSPMMGYQVEAKNIPLLNRLYGVTDDDNTRAIYNRYADHVRSAQVLKKQLKGTEEERDLLDARRNVFSVEKQYTAVNTELNKVKQAKKDLAKRYPKRGEAYYNQLKLLEKREEKIMQKFNRVAHRAGLTME